jgi:site-specific recombinase XerD
VLQRYFIKPTTIDRIRACWMSEAIEHYVAWLTEQNYAARNVFVRVPILVRFGEFTKARGVSSWNELPAHVEPFVDHWLREHGQAKLSDQQRRAAAGTVRNPIQQLLHLVIPDYQNKSRGQDLANPFRDRAPEFFEFLRCERGLRESTIVQYQHYLRRLEGYLDKLEMRALSDLSPAVLSAFITDSGRELDKRSVQSLCSILKVFLSFLYRNGKLERDLSCQIESPRRYRLASLPRSITWPEVHRMLETVDRRSPIGKRDYAILLLLVTYGLRAREVAALTLDEIDWKRERFQIRERKAGHSTVYPLSATVGEAVLDYIQHGRPNVQGRALFFRGLAPYTPLTWVAVSLRAKYYLRKAGIEVARSGSHTLRHTCVQRLVDAHLSFKTIGDYVGHRTPDATNIYAKVSIESLREVALGSGEEIL